MANERNSREAKDSKRWKTKLHYKHPLEKGKSRFLKKPAFSVISSEIFPEANADGGVIYK
jgi:hypothetical protein